MDKKSFLPLGLLLVVTLLSGAVLSSSVSFADIEETKDATVTVSSACTMFRESTIAHAITTNVGSYHENVGTTRLKTICNDKDGYAIYVIGYSNDTPGNTNMYGEENGETIPTGTESGDVSNWSMKLAKDLNSYNPENLTITTGFENYHVVPSIQTKVASFEGATDTTDGSVITTTYAIRVSSTQLADTYVSQVRYTMVHPSDGVVPEGPEPEYIQNITPETCSTTPTTMIDSRDGEEYTIQKLADGNCWMLDNLRLDLTAVSLDTLKGRTNASDTTLNYLKNGGGTTSDQYATDGVANWTIGYSCSAPLISTTNKDMTGTGGYEAGKYGVYYNYCAASAGSYCYGNGSSAGTSSGDASEDICPKGWRMPTSGPDGEYQALYTAYSSVDADFVNALRTPLPGFFTIDSAISQGSSGLFWSSIWYDNDNMRSLAVFTTGVDPQTTRSNRLVGGSVRCVAKDPEVEPEIVYYMQNVDEWGGLVGVGDSVIAIDGRDNKEYWVTRIEVDPDIPDGRADCDGTGSERVCTQLWMTQNLDLDLNTEKTFTHADTDLGWSNNDENVVWTSQAATAVTASGFTDSREEERSVSLDDEYYVTSNSSSDDDIYTLVQCIAAGYSEYNCEHYHAGNLYNYYAAAALGATSGGDPVTVGTSDYSEMPNSVCPAGWRLPTGLTALNGYSDFDYLLYKNNVTAAHSGYNTDAGFATHFFSNNEVSTDGFNNLRTQPLWFVRAGSAINGKVSNRASVGGYWSSIVKSGSSAYVLYFDYGQVEPASGTLRERGRSVRCVARGEYESTWTEPEPDPKLYIQDVTDATCPTTPTLAYDRRDGNAYTIRKLDDGKCWMTENLRLIGRTISSEGSNLPEGKTFTVPNSAAEFGTYTTNTAVNAAIVDNNSGYYSFYVATAGWGVDGAVTGDAPYDICPKGWHIPSGEYSYLYSHYKSFELIQGDPGFGLDGYYINGDIQYRDIYGYYWASNVIGSNASMVLLLNNDSSGVFPTATMRTDLGVPVRCVANDVLPRSDYYMQDVAEWKDSLSINQSVKAIDKRDGKEYWVTKLKTDSSIPDDRADCTGEGNGRVCTQIWMTQNLDLDLKSTKTYTHYDTDLGWTTGDADTVFNVSSSTTMGTGFNPTISGFDPGNVYVYTSGTTANDTKFESLDECVDAGHSADDCQHYHAGNIYWFGTATAAAATINGETVVVDNSQYNIAPNSICPAGWKLPEGPSSYSGRSDYDYVLYENGVILTPGDDSNNGIAFYAGNGFNKVRSAPFWFTRVGYNSYDEFAGNYWTNTYNQVMSNTQYAFGFEIYSAFALTKFNNSNPTPVRCVARESIVYGNGDNGGGSGSGTNSDYVPDIQDITPASCPTTPTVVRDTRDGSTYTIQKLADGKCWMLDNLRLGRNSIKVLTPDDTNIRSNYTLPGSVSVGFDEFELAQINVDSKNDTTSYGDGENKIGVYYNYCAATAGTYCQAEGMSSGTPAEDICPKGWRLPTGGDNGEYQNLYNQYNSFADFKNALRASLSGYFKYSSTNHQGSYGSFWSSTPVGDDKIYSLDVRATSVPNDFTSYRTAGISIRCVAYDAPEVYIQNITLDSCPTTPTVVYDTRDNSAYTIQKLADGNCWMLDNLRLGKRALKVLTPENTNITSNFTLPASIDSGFNSYIYPQINIDSKDKVTSYGDGDNKIGVYYNYCAATAGTYCMPRYEANGLAEQDICPKGWRLPTGGEEGEFQNLYEQYNTYSDFKNALHASLSGYFKYSNDNHQGSYGSYWSNTPVGDDRMYSLDVRATSVPNDFSSYRTAGLSIRCIAKKIYIQDVTKATCPTNPTVVYDKRDDNKYTIRKLADGNCWMTDNLRIGSDTTTTVLTSEDSNLFEGQTFTLPVANPADFPTTPNLNKIALDPTYGGYYSFYAATVGWGTYTTADGNAPADICPKGWRLPTGSSDGELQALYGYYNSSYQMREDPGFMLGGNPWEGNYVNQGSVGRYWSSTFKNGVAYYMYMSPSFVNPNYNDNEIESGRSIHCVAKDPALQDITIDTCPTTPTQVYDNRDGEYYTIQKLADGRCWMIDSLRLDGNTIRTAINSNNTNVPEGHTFSLSTTSYTDVNTFAEPRANYSKKNTVLSIGNVSSKAGVYYNFCAASAGIYCESTMSIDAQYDICPKGWRLPTGGSSGEFKNLFDNYSNSEFMDVFRTVKAGYYYTTSLQEWGTDGHWWSSTRYSSSVSNYMKGLGITSSNTVNPDAYSYRATAVMIRCILK